MVSTIDKLLLCLSTTYIYRIESIFYWKPFHAKTTAPILTNDGSFERLYHVECSLIKFLSKTPISHQAHHKMLFTAKHSEIDNVMLFGRIWLALRKILCTGNFIPFLFFKSNGTCMLFSFIGSRVKPGTKPLVYNKPPLFFRFDDFSRSFTS